MVAFDTLEIVKPLRGAGFDEPQAEAVTGALRDLRDGDFSNLATKADLERLGAANKADLERLGAATKADLERFGAATKADLEHLAASNKADIARLEANLDRLETKFTGEMARLDAKIDTRVAELKADIIRWVFGIVFAQGALILGVLRFFPAGHP